MAKAKIDTSTHHGATIERYCMYDRSQLVYLGPRNETKNEANYECLQCGRKFILPICDLSDSRYVISVEPGLPTKF